MWLSQTYLGCPDPDARAFVYYLWEEYKDQQDVPPEIVKRLAGLGRAFGEKVSVFAPIPNAQHEIRSELRAQEYDFFWHRIGASTPGLLLTEKPLGKLDPHGDEYVFFPLPEGATGELVADVFLSLHQACYDATRGKEKEASVLRTIVDAVVVRPTIMGVGIDLKEMVTNLIRRE